MLRTRLSWLVIGGVAVILVAAAVDGLRSSGSKTASIERGLVRDGEREGQRVEEIPQPAIAEPEIGPLERCTAGQLALRVERGAPFLALAQVGGSPCRTARIPIQVRVFYRNGDPINPDKASVGVWPQAWASADLSLGVELIAEVQMSYLCGTRRPRRVVAEARPYVTRGWLPRSDEGCLDDFGP